ncbi:MAG: gamma carbonic anhydrase family protein [Verrucomicrobiae bacterium]|nr:gamma carbonic anhydrase family protein [Verrucomicrobiae bacterium]
MKNPVCPFLGETPKVADSAFLAPGTVIVGAVSIGENASVWYGSVLRADIERITIGRGSNLQDGTIVHLASDRGTIVGDYVTCGHRCLLHACTIGDEVLVGMGATVMDGAEVGTRSIIGAGSLVTKNQVIPPGSLVMGSPAKVVRQLTEDEQYGIRHWAEKYIQVAKEHCAHLAGQRNGKPDN